MNEIKLGDKLYCYSNPGNNWGIYHVGKNYTITFLQKSEHKGWLWLDNNSLGFEINEDGGYFYGKFFRNIRLERKQKLENLNEI